MILKVKERLFILIDLTSVMNIEGLLFSISSFCWIEKSAKELIGTEFVVIPPHRVVRVKPSKLQL